jgi:hypothetical protein
MAILTGAVSDNFVLRLRGQRHVLLYCDIFLGISWSGWRRFFMPTSSQFFPRVESLAVSPPWLDAAAALIPL